MPSTEEILDDLKRDNDRNIRVFDNWKDTFGKLFESMVEKAIKANDSYEELKSREREMNEEPEVIFFSSDLDCLVHANIGAAQLWKRQHPHRAPDQPPQKMQRLHA